MALLQTYVQALRHEARAYAAASNEGVDAVVRSSEEQVAAWRQLRAGLDARRGHILAIEESERSLVSSLQEQIMSQSELVEQLEDARRKQIVDLTKKPCPGEAMRRQPL